MSIDIHITCEQAYEIYGDDPIKFNKLKVYHQYDDVVLRPGGLTVFNIGFKMKISFLDIMAKFYPSKVFYMAGYRFLPEEIDHESDDIEINLGAYSIYSGMPNLRVDKGFEIGHFKFERFYSPTRWTLTHPKGSKTVQESGGFRIETSEG